MARCWPFGAMALALVFTPCGLTRALAMDSPTVRIQAASGRVGMGETVHVEAVATLPGGRSPAGTLLLPYVNGRRWGAHEYANARGRAGFDLPLPNPGIAEVQVECVPPWERWAWATKRAARQTIWLQHAFDLPAGATGARLRVAVDDVAEVFLNGHRLGRFNGWQAREPVPGVLPHLRSGRNVLSVEAYNGELPCGFLLRLEVDTPAGPVVEISGSDWRSYETKPAGWPAESKSAGEPVVLLTATEELTYANELGRWHAAPAERLLAGTRAPEGAFLSNPLSIRVPWRRLTTPPADPEHLIGAQYCTLFAPHNFNWSTAQAVPLVGFYHSWNPDVLRQHLIWLAESGVDFLLVDWSNQLWDRAHWDDRSDAANEIVHTTTMLFEVAATMREQGLPVPRMVLFIGVNNGPSTTMTAVNEAIAWVHHNYVRNPRFHGLSVEYLSKPLLIVFNGAGPEWLKSTKQVPVDDRFFTIRWMSSQHQLSPHNEAGYWSWMDGNLRQPFTKFRGAAEVMTVSTAFFDQGGWTAPSAHGRRGGWTYVESFRNALKVRPRFLQLHQFQEFTGAPEGSTNWFGDTYSVELSDDIEPVSLTTPAYRGNGGWGFHFLNLTRALVDVYRQKVPETTVLAIARPIPGSVVTGNMLNVEWTSIGKTARGFSLALNGKSIARALTGTEATIDLSGVQEGPVVLRLSADGGLARYPLSYAHEARPQTPLVPAFTEVEFTVRRK